MDLIKVFEVDVIDVVVVVFFEFPSQETTIS